jgi:hypothetical protein
VSNLMSRGRSMLARNLKAAAGVTATYTRGDYSVTLTGDSAVWIGNTLFRLSDADGLRMQWGERDYLIASADLVLNGTAVEPAENDRITETINGTAITFEVLPVSPSEPAWRWSDPDRTVYRIHVKRVA